VYHIAKVNVCRLPNCHDFHRSWSLSLFGRRSAVEVTDLLAIDPLFIFHWFCLVFHRTWFQSHQLHVVYLTLCSPSCPCGWLFVVSACARLSWCVLGYGPIYFISLFSRVLFVNKLRCWKHSYALLRLTSLPPVRTPYTNKIHEVFNLVNINNIHLICP
jgi:hypothetical protein